MTIHQCKKASLVAGGLLSMLIATPASAAVTSATATWFNPAQSILCNNQGGGTVKFTLIVTGTVDTSWYSLLFNYFLFTVYDADGSSDTTLQSETRVYVNWPSPAGTYKALIEFELHCDAQDCTIAGKNGDSDENPCHDIWVLIEDWKGVDLFKTGKISVTCVVPPPTTASALFPSRGTVSKPNVPFSVQIPTGSADYVCESYDVVSGIGNSESLADGLPLKALAVSVADFGSGATFPRLGVYLPNLGMDPSGNTPDLASPIVESYSPAMPAATPTFYHVVFDLPSAAIPAGASKAVASVQLPPGDPGLLAIGASSSTSPSGYAGYTADGFGTPAASPPSLDFAINPGQDNSGTTSCRQADRRPHGRLRVGIDNALSSASGDPGSGDHLTQQVSPGDMIGIAFFGSKSGDKWRLYFNAAPCTPAVGIGPVLPTIADGDGAGSYMRLSAPWPAGYGGQTFRFSAVWGNPACGNPGVGFTNCITVITPPEPAFGVCDDGTIEAGFAVQIPAGSSDYLNNAFSTTANAPNGIVGVSMAVLDFGVTQPAFPAAGVSNANLAVDATGHTPDVASPLAMISPFTFPAGTFATTSGQYVSHATAIAGGSLRAMVHAWVQYPPGDTGLLGIGLDLNSPSAGCSYFSIDGYTSPAVSFGGNAGLRLVTN